MENGVYKSENAIYFVKDDKVMMLLRGEYYQTNNHFMLGAKLIKPLTNDMLNEFDKAYNSCKKW